MDFNVSEGYVGRGWKGNGSGLEVREGFDDDVDCGAEGVQVEDFDGKMDVVDAVCGGGAKVVGKSSEL